MLSPNYQPDEALKAKRRGAEAGPRADRPRGGARASALGNAAVQRILRSLGMQRSVSGPGGLDESIARAIQAKRGTGQSLDSAARRDIEPALGQDFSDVRVHTDAEADRLNRVVQAEAFTTGRDIFFRSGKYNPGSSEGRSLLSHELTHVVQQGAAPPAQELTVSDPNDASERQASAVAEHLSGSSVSATPSFGRQAAEEEEEVATSLERQAAPEEEEHVATSLERQAAPEEEEEVAASLKRQAAPPEEEEETPAG